MSSGFPPATFNKALSHSDSFVPLTEPRFPEAVAAAVMAAVARSRFSLTFLRFDNRLGLCGVWPGDDDEEDEESLRLGVLDEEILLTANPPPATLSCKVTSATARHTSMRAWKYVEKRLCSDDSAKELPEVLPPASPQHCVSWS